MTARGASARPAPSGPPADATGLAVASCPTDPAVVLRRQHEAIDKAMKQRANGTRHLDGCRNARVNSQWFPCSDDCLDAQIALVWGRVWISRHERPQPEQRALRLEVM